MFIENKYPKWFTNMKIINNDFQNLLKTKNNFKKKFYEYKTFSNKDIVFFFSSK